MPRDLLQNELFVCNHIGVSEQDEEDILNFSVRDEKGKGLVYYLQHDAVLDENNGRMRTYIVRDNATSEMVGYFSLKAGLLSYNEHNVPIIDEKTGEIIVNNETGEVMTRLEFDTLPGVELANFAINQSYIRKHPDMKGVGEIIYQRFIHRIVENAAETIGIKTLYVFALPYQALIARYEQYGLERLDEGSERKVHKRLKPSYDESCIFMFEML